MKKTFGGDRLGSGKRMMFDTKTFKRSTHNLSDVFRSTMSAGTLVPFMCIPGLPGDTMDIDLEVDIKTLPTIGPLYGSYKIQLDLFQIPWRIYIRSLQMNKLGIGNDMKNVYIPQMQIATNDISVGLQFEYSKETPWGGKEINNCQIEPSTLLSYLGIKGIGQKLPESNVDIITREFNSMPVLMYWDIVKQYYANKMEDNAYVISNSLRTQDELVESVKFITNNIVNDVELNNDFSVVISEQLAIIIQFANYDNYASWLEEEFVMKREITFGGEQIVYLKKGSKDWIIERNDSQLRVYYNSRFQPETPWTSEITLYSDVKYDYIRPNLAAFPLKNIDEMREQIMTKSSTSPLILNGGSIRPYGDMFRRNLHSGGTVYEITALQCKQEGLAVKTYQSDKNNNWLNSEWIDGTNGVNAVTSIQVDENGRFTLDEFNIKKKVYDMLNHIAASGGTYDDWQDVLWGVDRMKIISSPVFEGGLSQELVFQEVISNAASNADGEQALGTLAGRGVVGNGRKGGQSVIKVYEPSYIIGIASITPRLDYSTGNEWHMSLKNMAELHNPYLDGIGYQDLITDNIAFWDTKVQPNNVVIYKSAGKQTAWINYQTSVNRVFGNFALQNEQMFMVLNRRYELDYQVGEGYSIGDLTTYVDPKKFNHIFADTAPDAMNFQVQIGIRNIARRMQSASEIPNL